MIRVYVLPPHARSKNYRLRWQVGRKWKERTAGTSIPKEAQRAALLLEAELNAGRSIDGRLTWDAFCTRYEREHLSGLSRRSLSAWASVRNHVARLLGWEYLQDASPDSLSVLVGMLREAKLRESSIATHLRQLLTALNWAYRMRLIAHRIEFHLPKRGRRQSQMRSRPITPVEFVTMLCVIPAVRASDAATWEHLLMGLWLSGLRLGEVLTFSWDSHAPIAVSLEHRRPHFRIWSEAEKGRQNRLLPMTPDFAAWLLQTPQDRRSGLVFKLPYRTSENIGKVISAIGEAAGVVVNADGKHATAHDLRRSFGTRWASKVKPSILQMLMRHEDIATTMNFYVSIDADDAADDLWNIL